MKITLTTCKGCDKEFETEKIKGRKLAEYCSFRCRKPKLIMRKCLNCRKDFEVMENMPWIFCSDKCRNKYREEKGKGTSKRGKDWEEARKRQMKKDLWKCTKCGKSNIMLHVHHKIPYRKTKDNSIANLTTLCSSCHLKEENKRRRFGKA